MQFLSFLSSISFGMTLLCAVFALLVAFLNSTGQATSSSSCCAALQSALQSQVFNVNTDTYQRSVESYWSLDTQLRPACIVQPRNPQEVSLAVTTLVTTNDQSPQCQFAIRSGGHSAVPGTSNIQGGVTIDLSLLNSTVYHPDKGFASIGPGARWESVYKELKQYDVTVTGGRDATVGVGGLITGGGNSFFAAEHGFGCDNVVNFEIILANGSLINANNSTHADLWKALKGGSGNFGIVTRFDLTTFPHKYFWGGMVEYDGFTTPQQISALVDFTDRIAEDRYASLLPMYRYDSSSDFNRVAVAMHYTKPEAFPSAFQDFYRLPNISSTVRFDHIYNFTREMSPLAGLHHILLTQTFINDARVVQKAIELQNHYISEAKAKAHGNDWTLISLFQPFPAVFGQLAKHKGGNMLGLDDENNHILYLLGYSWDNTADNDLFNSIGYKVFGEVQSYAKELGVDGRYVYLNYAGKGQNPLQSYGEDNAREIARVAKTYDPQGVFQRQVPGGFKISMA
ncbi:hypothetical protein BDV25DRAFT_20937 [Aspergillus avenaceus]|uniref:FAD-binding PCMH-type domain-containing protein n=1 Tax=Aspergillus avenaceus TaxID=36643 RepID=A0A5N6TPZ1_ASPAV|nr:hypothetical protein BDV25DRAFT_20937 [Aspergillus avenaceus]